MDTNRARGGCKAEDERQPMRKSFKAVACGSPWRWVTSTSKFQIPAETWNAKLKADLRRNPSVSDNIGDAQRSFAEQILIDNSIYMFKWSWTKQRATLSASAPHFSRGQTSVGSGDFILTGSYLSAIWRFVWSFCLLCFTDILCTLWTWTDHKDKQEFSSRLHTSFSIDVEDIGI